MILIIFYVICVSLTSHVWGEFNNETDKFNKPYGYHGRVGIKRAAELLREEFFSNRIIGGSHVPQNNHISHQAGIVVTLTSGWTSVCGGAVLSNNRVVTAAHCWYDGQSQGRQFTVVLGSTTLFTGGTRLVTSDVVTHPSWNTADMTYDIAMVTIPRVEFTNYIQPVALPAVADVNKDFAGLKGQISGYGKTSDAQSTFPTTTSLHQTTVSIITKAECQKSFDFNLHVGHLCSSGQGRVGTCDGDSGGPLTVVYNNRRTLIGVVSFGPEKCEASLPSVYTRVTAFLGWINDNL